MDKAVKNVILSLLISMAFILSSASVVFGDVKKADVAKLVQILGRKIAIDVKKQVGEDIDKEKVPERK